MFIYVLQAVSYSMLHLAQRQGWVPGGVLLYMGYIGVCAAVKGMVFKQFTLG